MISGHYRKQFITYNYPSIVIVVLPMAFSNLSKSRGIIHSLRRMSLRFPLEKKVHPEKGEITAAIASRQTSTSSFLQGKTPVGIRNSNTFDVINNFRRSFLKGPSHAVSSSIQSSKSMESVPFPNFRLLFGLRGSKHVSLMSGSYGSYRPYGGGQLDFRRNIGGSSTAVWGLLLANVAVFSAWQVVDNRFMKNNFMISYENLHNGRYHTLITNAFSHQEPYHLFTNMLGLFFFGSEVASLFGGKYLVSLYLISGLGASLCHLAYIKYIYQNQQQGRPAWYQPRFYDLPALGASGAVNAIVLLDCLLFPTRIVYLNFFIPVPGILLGLGFILHDLYGVTNTSGRVGHAAHLGGAFIGLAAWILVRLRRF